MYLGNRKVKKMGYDHYLGTQDLTVPDSDISKIVQEYRDGNLDLRNQLVEHHIRLVMSIVGRYHGKGYKDVDDLVSVALLALVDAIDKAATRLYDNNITGYVVSHLHYRLYHYILESDLIRIPQRTQDRGVKRISTSSIHGEDFREPSSPATSDPLVIKEIWQRACKTKSDREVLDLTLKGYNDVEISKILQVPRLTIYNIKMKMKGRLNGY